ncbi:glutathione S-transferase [Mariannaea sp. PMI_226]|nr:glutathione S-transferase [Mariannaea sp. PMI_226]
MPEYTLYSYFRSSCSARLRIVLALKGVSCHIIPVNLLKNEQYSEAHTSLNPSASVPLLCHETLGRCIKIGQSVAAMEYLDELHPQHPLLPPTSDPAARAKVRVLVNIISSDVQPVTNLRVLRRVRDLGGSVEEWNRDLMRKGLLAYESIIQTSAERYSIGNEITMADICLIPAIWNAERYGVELYDFPTIARVVDALEKHSAVTNAHWRNQIDTPDELRYS